MKKSYFCFLSLCLFSVTLFSCASAKTHAGNRLEIHSIEELKSLFPTPSESALLSQAEMDSLSTQEAVFAYYRSGVTAAQGGDFVKAYGIFYNDVFVLGDDKGIENLAELVLNGSGITQDVQKAMAVYEFIAKEKKAGRGYSSLGKIYEAKTGTYPGITQSFDTALDYFKKSYQDKDIKSADFKGPRYVADYYDSGYTHDDGTVQKPDYKKAEEAYLLAAKGNGRTFDGTSCYKLGTYYEEGREGVAKDPEKAFVFYTKAVSDPNTHSTMLGIPQSYLSLARLYESGNGTQKDMAKAKEFYEKALTAANETLALEFAAGKEAAVPVQKEAQAALERIEK